MESSRYNFDKKSKSLELTQWRLHAVTSSEISFSEILYRDDFKISEKYKMKKKKKNIILVVPAFLIMGAAIGIQTKGVIKQTLIGLVVGIVIYFFLKYRNKKINN